MTPSQIGRYRIVSPLGAGGMGEVYLAEDTSLGRRVALKILTTTSDPDSDRVRRFAQEARLASAVTHPNIAQIFEIGEADGVSFIAMEYVEGEALSTRLQRGPLPPDDVIEIGLQTFDALDEAHARGIVHRDLKPANIIMTPRGRIKILDFGLAKLTDVDAAPQTQATRLDTDPGLILGTVHYMSPEQALGRSIDRRSDIFSAGVVMYELLTGRLPFAGRTVTETLDRIVHHQPDSVTRLNYSASPELERIIKKALEKEPPRRYQTAKDAHIDLSNLKRDSDSDVHSRAGVKPKRSSKTVQSVAVLPLATASDAADMDYMAEGITEALINALSQLPKLKVLARSTVFRYMGRDVDPQVVGRELGVRAVLLGRLQAVGDRLVVRAELVDTNDGTHIWGGQFQRRASDVFTLQEELAAEIADQLKVKLSRDDRKRLQKRHTEDPRAYESYLRGRFQLAKRTLEGLAKAIESFDQAIAHDPAYALAYAGLADCHTLLGTGAYGTAPVDAASRARQAAEHAIRLDERLAEAHAALGFVQFRIDWNWPAAEVSLMRACVLNPGHAPAHHQYALLLSVLARHDEAIAEIRRAYELDPLSLIIGTAYGRALHFARRSDEAIEQLRHTLDIDARFVQAHFDLAMAFSHTGRYGDAIAELESQIAQGDRRSTMVAVLGYTYAKSGDEDRARVIISELADRRRAGTANAVDPVYVHAALGEIEVAIDLLEQAVDGRVGLLVFLKVEPMLDPLRDHPRFVHLLQRLRLA
jgi:serine/threonine protein kinase/Tfp pilus assembly protein PilF